MITESNQEPNSSENSNYIDRDITLEQESIEQIRPDVEFVNSNILISRQIPSEMPGSKVKRLRKKIRKQGFDAQKPINVANVGSKANSTVAAIPQALYSIQGVAEKVMI
jgi:hypothetical protein